MWCAEELRKDRGGVKVALLNGAQDAGEDFLGMSAASGAIASTDFAGDDRRPQRVFGAPIGRVDGIRLEEKGEDRGKFDREMRGKSARDVGGSRTVEEGIESVLQMPASHRDAMRGDRVVQIAVAHVQGVLQDLLDAGRKPALVMVADQIATAPQQMRETRLMDRGLETPIRRPAVADKDRGEVGPQHRGRFFEAAAGLNGVDRRVRRGVGPQPLQPRVDLPAGFIRGHHGTPANGGAERRVGRFGLVGHPAHRVHQAACGDGQAEALAEECGDLAERQPQLLVEDDRERDGGGPQLRGGGAEGIGGLQRMAALDAPAAVGALPNRDVKRSHPRSNDREIFLILRRMARQHDVPAARRTRRWQRGRVGLIDVRRRDAMGSTTVGRTRFPPRAARTTPRDASRKGGGLPMQRASGVIELVFEPVDFLPELVPLLPIPIPVLISPLMLTAQPFDFPLLPFQLSDQFVARRGAPLRSQHTLLMPSLGEEYKQKRRRSRCLDGGSRGITR